MYGIVDYHYPQEYETTEKDEEAWKYDYCVLVLEKDLGEEHGWVGIDASKENTKKVEQVEVCGYPGDKIAKTGYKEFPMWRDSGEFKVRGPFLTYDKIST